MENTSIFSPVSRSHNDSLASASSFTLTLPTPPLTFQTDSPPSLIELFDVRRSESSYVRFLAPLVRYSKLPFRLLCRSYSFDVASTPMIVSSSFNRSLLARRADFSTTTNLLESPLVVQFGASSASEFVRSAEIVSSFGLVSGVELNCGCPQGWAMSDGLGSALLNRSHIVAEAVKLASQAVKIPIAIKIRILPDLRKTVDLVRAAEAAGVSYLTVHGRTPQQKSEPVNTEAIKLVRILFSPVFLFFLSLGY
jgi:tRNA-dihydrouridine synthase 4